MTADELHVGTEVVVNGDLSHNVGHVVDVRDDGRYALVSFELSGERCLEASRLGREHVGDLLRMESTTLARCEAEARELRAHLA